MRKVYLALAIIVIGCADQEKNTQERPLFQLMTPAETGILFTNQLSFDEEFNVYTYRNYYNGGGVAIGDINNDGLVDLYFTSNLSENKLYLNMGNFKFEDITELAGVGGTRGWSTGVTMADVNGDGWLDIYVCNSGDIEGDNKQNELFINNQDNTFSEEAEKYRLDDRGYGTHASFFDYDQDGDLDVYLLNNSYQAIGSFNLERNERIKRDSLGGDKLLRNNGGFYEDVSEEAGIYSSVIGFGLGVTVGDVNRDGWEDIYVSNDFFERDYLYLNNQNGSFTENLLESMNAISGASMGADMADVNNDGYGEIFVTEMLPGDYSRLKSVTTFENWDKYQYNVANGYYHQFTRNTFQLNNTNNTFSEVGRLSGVEASDWSWGALIFDMDNDGFKDLFIANGIYQDLTNQDYLNYISNEEVMRSIITKNKVDYKKLIEIIPSNPISNKAFKNNGKLIFEDMTIQFGLDSVSFSNGAAYGDLDNDGDLDLVINNVNMPSFIYKNNLIENGEDANYIRFKLEGQKQNKFAVGAQIEVTQNSNIYYVENQPTRGFQSSVDHRPFLGLEDSTDVNITITWPSGKVTVLKKIKPNQTLKLKETEGEINFNSITVSDPTKAATLFTSKLTDILHKENQYVDFYRDRLIYHMNSTEGPDVATGDINGDGYEDLYVGGSKGYSGQLIYLGPDGLKIDSVQMKYETGSEDTGAVFFDADNDGDLDLYVCTGGSEFPSSSSLLRDKLYFNNSGKFSLSSQVLPVSDRMINSSVVVPFDYDADGDEDLFIGERMVPFQYGHSGSGFLLQNDGKGNFTEVSKQVAPGFENLGMITDAAAIDIDGDNDLDLVITGEFMGIHFFVNNGGIFEVLNNELSDLKGWWNTVHPLDIDNDGDIDFVAGNHGLNSRFKATKEQPIILIIADFDKNGFMDPILAHTNKNGDTYPYALRHNLAEQLKFVLKKYPDYGSFKDATLPEILGQQDYENALKKEVNTLGSILIINNGNNKFSYKPLPLKAQFSPVYSVASNDFDKDGDIDLVIGGNLYAVKPEVGRYDASYGLYLENVGNHNFVTFPDNKGFIVKGEVRDIFITGGKLFVARNNDYFLQFDF
ncbi:MAG: VCBS repeat-containing protein [Candidatus Cyclobacteriaceae bacterium M2_1C_046]